MLMNLFLGLSLMLLCLGLQLLLLLAVISYYQGHRSWIGQPTMGSGFRVVGNVMLVLVAGNLIQIAAWAALFVHLGEFDGFPEAFYHSAVNFSTLGYGDLVMSPRHRLLGPLEAVNGILMIGLSTSVLMAVLQKIIRRLWNARGEGEGER